MSETIEIKCVVTCRNSEGTPDMHPVLVYCTPEQYDDGQHYVSAKINAINDGYENCGIVYDANDYPELMDMFNFDGQTNYINISRIKADKGL